MSLPAPPTFNPEEAHLWVRWLHSVTGISAPEVAALAALPEPVCEKIFYKGYTPKRADITRLHYYANEIALITFNGRLSFTFEALCRVEDFVIPVHGGNMSLRNLRRNKQLSNPQFADHLGFETRTWRSWEENRAVLDAANWEAVALALGIPQDSLRRIVAKTSNRTFFANWLKEARQAKGLSLATLASRMRVNPPCCARWESGASNFSQHNIVRLARALDVPVEVAISAYRS